MMDYATTFCDYAELDDATRRQAQRRWNVFPPAVSLGTIAMVSATVQLAALWGIFAAGLGVTGPGHVQLRDLLAGLPLAGLLGLYWYSAGLLSPERLTETGQRRLLLFVLLNSFGGATLAVLLLGWLEHRQETAVLRDGLLTGAAVLLLAVSAGSIARQFLRHTIRCQRLACDIVLAGEPAAMRSFIRQMREHHAGVRICATFILTPGAQIGEIEGVPTPGGIAELLSFHARFPEPRVVIVGNMDKHALESHLAPLRMQPLHVLAMSEPPGTADFAARVCTAGVPGVRLTPLLAPPLRPVDHLVKGAFDRMTGLVALILFTPVMLGCAVMIKLTSPGPVFYRQKRIGYRNKMFNVYKFRSMHLSDCNRITLTKRGDARVFAFGRLMRKLSLDELPQLFNVIRGEMSLVGPRPHMREARAGENLYYDIVPDYASRHRVKPGITGWAQVNGWRGPTETDHAIRARVEHDLYYIENWSLWLDIKILFRTVAGGFAGSNAF